MGSGCSTLPQEDAPVDAPEKSQVPNVLPPVQGRPEVVANAALSAPKQLTTAPSSMSELGSGHSINASQFSAINSVASLESCRSPIAVVGTVPRVEMSDVNVPVVAAERAAKATLEGVEVTLETYSTADSTRRRRFVSFPPPVEAPLNPGKRNAFRIPLVIVPPSTSVGVSSPPLGFDGRQEPASPRRHRSGPATPGRYSDITVTFISLSRRH